MPVEFVIRPLRPEEKETFAALDSYCFHVPREELRFLEHVFRLEQSLACVGSEGELLAALLIYPFQLYVDGRPVPMGGIASVVGAPEHRRRGHVGRVLRAALAQMKEGGVSLSTLYPFDYGFYRRYGWELAANRLVCSVPITQLSSFGRAEGRVERVEAGNWEGLAPVYAAWAPGRPGAFDRDAATWAKWSFAAWRRQPLHGAIWRPSAGAPAEGYLLYRFGGSDADRNLEVRELVALTPGALRGLLGYVANHDSQVQTAIFHIDPEVPLAAVLGNPRVEPHLQPAWMLRLVDLPAAMAARRPDPGAAGRVTVAVHDPQAPWNTGVWTLSWAEGRCAAEPAGPGQAPDLELDIAALSMLYAGYLPPQALALAGRVQVQRPAALPALASLFPHRPWFFYEFF